MTIVMSSLSKTFVFKTWFALHTKTVTILLNVSGLKGVSEKLCFHSGSVWTVHLTLGGKAPFCTFRGVCSEL